MICAEKQLNYCMYTKCITDKWDIAEIVIKEEFFMVMMSEGNSSVRTFN